MGTLLGLTEYLVGNDGQQHGGVGVQGGAALGEGEGEGAQPAGDMEQEPLVDEFEPVENANVSTAEGAADVRHPPYFWLRVCSSSAVLSLTSLPIAFRRLDVGVWYSC